MRRIGRQQKIDIAKEAKEGVIDEILNPGKEWRVKVQGIYWHARTTVGTNFSPGEHIQVVGRQNSKLLIAPM